MKFKNASSSPRVQILDLRVQLYELRIQIHEFKFTTYELNFTSYEFKSTSSRIIKSIKMQVNSFKISSFPKILSLISFGNSFTGVDWVRAGGEGGRGFQILVILWESVIIEWPLWKVNSWFYSVFWRCCQTF